MSQTMQYPVSDPYLANPNGGMWIPQNDLTVDPQYGSIRMLTPICRAAYLNIARPRPIQQPDGTMGAPQFSATLLLNPNACMDLYRAIVAVATNRFPPEMKPDPANPSVLKQFTADELLFVPRERGGLHYPLRQGAENYMRDPVKFEQWRELFFINASMKATDSNGNPQSPIYFDESGNMCDPTKFYSGCYLIAQITLFAYPKAGQQGRGSRGVGVGLNSVRFNNHGQKLGGFDAAKSAGDAFARAGAIPVPAAAVAQMQQQAHPGYGPHTATPGSVPPNVEVPGFAAPPQQPAAQPYGQGPSYPSSAGQMPQQPYVPQQGQPIPPHQPPAYVPQGGARPPV